MKYIYPVLAVVLLCPFLLTAQQKNSTAFQNSPQGFYENKGQIIDQYSRPNTAVKYLLSSPGFNVQLRQTGFSYDTYTDSVIKTRNPQYKNMPHTLHEKNAVSTKIIRNVHRVDIELQGCNQSADLVPEQKSTAYFNYFTGGTPEGGISNVHYYNRVTYKNIYPNIDLVFYIRAGSPVDYDFIVHPGGNTADIKLAYNGATGVKLSGAGLDIDVDAGRFTEKIPAAYIINNNLKQPVKVSYSDLGSNVFGFLLPAGLGEIKSDLVIDPNPNLSWGTYYATISQNECWAITLDKHDNSYITGWTQSTSQIATTGSYRSTLYGYGNTFVAKINPTGTSLLWGTYYGGNDSGGGGTNGYAITLDAAGNVYIAGGTDDVTHVATAGTYQPNIADSGATNAFIAKFNPTGSSLLWATYFGGSNSTKATGIALDAHNNVYIVANTLDQGLATNGGYYVNNQAYFGLGDVIFAKFNPTGSSLIYATYYAANYGYAIAVDNADAVYLVGMTNYGSGVRTVGAYQAGGSNGNAGYIAKFSASGDTLLWGSSYGDYSTYVAAVALDAQHNVYVTGYTNGSQPPGFTTPGSWSPHFAPVYYGNLFEGFVSKFNAAGDSLLWGTYFGDSSTQCLAIGLDAANNVYIAGETQSLTGIATAQAYQKKLVTGSHASPFNTFVAEISSTGSQLVWGTYYGSGSTYAAGLAVDSSANVFIAGTTSDSVGVATPGAWQTSAGWDNGFVAEFSPAQAPQGFLTANGPFCDTGTVKLTFTTTGGSSPFTVVFNNGAGNDTVANVLSGVAFTVSGGAIAATTTYTLVSVTGSDTVTRSSSFSGSTATATVYPLPAPGFTGTATGCGLVAITATGGATYNWSGGSTPATAANTFTSSATYTVTVTSSHSCSATASKTITVYVLPTVTISAGGPLTFCWGDSVVLTASQGVSYLWNTTGNNAVTQAVTARETGSYTVAVTDANNCSATSAPTVVTVNPLPTALITESAGTICPGTTDTLVASGGSFYAWNNGYGTNATITVSPSVNTVYSVTVTNSNNCSITTSQTVNVGNVITGSITGPQAVCPNISITLTAGSGNSYQWGNGLGSSQSVTVSPSLATTYTVTVTLGGGCSATASQTVSINPPVTTHISGSVCSGQSFTFHSQNLTEGGTYYDTLTTVNGCDSIVTLALSVTAFIDSAIVNNALCTALQSGAAYQWVNCASGQNIAGANGKTYTAGQSGNYQCQVTLGNCSGLTNCVTATVTGLDAVQPLFVKVYPNPTNGIFTVESNYTGNLYVRLHDMLGNMVKEINLNAAGKIIDITNLADGVYQLTLINNNELITSTRIVKQ